MSGSEAERITRMRNTMASQQIDALICLKPQNTFYLSQFNPIIYSHPVVVIFPVDAEPALLLHALRDDHARQTTWIRDVRLFGFWSTKKSMGGDWLAALQSILEERGLTAGTLGIEGDYLPVIVMRQLETVLPEARFVDATELIMANRMVKDASELEAARAASQIADIGMDAAIDACRRRLSEQEVSTLAMAAMNRTWIEEYPDYEVADFASAEGGIHNGLWCYCLSGSRIALNADNPTKKLLTNGEMALIVIWTNCDGIHAENERTVAIGTLDETQQAMYDAVLRIRRESVSAIKPNVTCADVYSEADGAYRRLGYGDYLPGRIGHGMGLGPHEHPSLAPDDTTLLQPGMLLTFEPNLRIPELGGLQHSNTVLVTETGYETLTQTPDEFIQV